MSDQGQISPRVRVRQREFRALAVAIILIGGMLMPLAARLIAEVSVPLAMVAPPAGLVGAAVLVYPRWRTPPVATAALYAVELAMLPALAGSPRASLLEQLAHGHWQWLWVPPAVLAAGYLLLPTRLRWQPTLFRRPFRTNLRILARRPKVFVRMYWLPLTVLFAGAVMDMVTTIRFMSETGPQDELHPFIRLMAEVYGVMPGVVAGTVGRLVFVVVIAAIWRRACAALMYLTGTLYILAALSNKFGWLEWLLVSY
jgi:hypothetical protein